MDRYAVMGNPIGHSLSPEIHAEFARLTNQKMSYEAILVEPDDFKNAIQAFKNEGGKGLNVTLPFKQEAWQLVDECSPQATLAQAVNTIVLNDSGLLYGHNTDGIGLVRDITQNHQTPLAQQSILIIGAGGAVRGVLEPILSEQPERVVIANRTAVKAKQLADYFSGFGNITGCGLTEIDADEFDIIINGTSASVNGELPAIPENCIKTGGFCYDMMYSRKPTAFVKWGNTHGAAKSVDGLGMLIEQAAESFYLWRNIRPDTGGLYQTLRNEPR